MSFITVLTPTYNRVSFLPRVFESLCKQTFQDFEWVVVDDGSTDNTAEVVKRLREDNHSSVFPVRYYRKENGGKHTAINYGVREAKGELLFILDSDDWLPTNALEEVVREYAKIKDDASYAGVAGLDQFENGELIGGKLPQEGIDCNAIEIRFKHRVKGDMKEVFRTFVLRQYSFPEISGERFCPEQLVWFRIAQKYKLHYFNKSIYIVEYQAKGITAGITKVRMNSPIASCLTYGEMLRYKIPFLQKVKAAINYWRFWHCLNRKEGDQNREFLPVINRFWSVLFPIGAMMHWGDIRNMKKGEV